MPKILIEFPSQEASGLFDYNNEGYLLNYTLTPGRFEQVHFDFLFKRFPKNLVMMKAWMEEKFPNVTFKIIEEDLSFDAFYNKYAHKVSKRSVAEKVWKNMPDTERAKAIAFIPIYQQHLLKTNVNKKYPETYLNSEMWNN